MLCAPITKHCAALHGPAPCCCLSLLSPPGGGAVEAGLSIYLENFATSLGSREQLAIAEFADALLVIPKTLAVNAAKVRGSCCEEVQLRQDSVKQGKGCCRGLGQSMCIEEAQVRQGRGHFCQQDLTRQ